jgi:hypothetical protein
MSLAPVGGPNAELTFQRQTVRLKATAAVAVGDCVKIAVASLNSSEPTAAPTVIADASAGSNTSVFAIATEAAAIGGYFVAVLQGKVDARASAAVGAGDKISCGVANARIDDVDAADWVLGFALADIGAGDLGPVYFNGLGLGVYATT